MRQYPRQPKPIRPTKKIMPMVLLRKPSFRENVEAVVCDFGSFKARRMFQFNSAVHLPDEIDRHGTTMSEEIDMPWRCAQSRMS